MNVFGFGGIETGYLPSTKRSCDPAPAHAVTSVFLIQKEASVDRGTLRVYSSCEENFRGFFVIFDYY